MKKTSCSSLKLPELKYLADLGVWSQIERKIRPFLGEVPLEDEIRKFHRKTRLELSRICEFPIEGFDYLGQHHYSCQEQSFCVSEYEHLLTGMDFVLLPPNGQTLPLSFWMGEAPSESFSDQNVLQEIQFTRPFLISKTVVTQKTWKRVMKENPAYFQCGENYPIETIRWYDSLLFCQKVDLNLPTEAHWEYACRGGTQSRFCYGDQLSSYANFYPEETDIQKPINQTTPVASYPPNAFGLYDMHGNVWEYCLEWNGQEQVIFNQNFSDLGVVFRGGSFSDGSDYCRSSFCLKNTPDHYGPDIGFRLFKLLPSYDEKMS